MEGIITIKQEDIAITTKEGTAMGDTEEDIINSLASFEEDISSLVVIINFNLHCLEQIKGHWSLLGLLILKNSTETKNKYYFQQNFNLPF